MGEVRRDAVQRSIAEAADTIERDAARLADGLDRVFELRQLAQRDGSSFERQSGCDGKGSVATAGNRQRPGALRTFWSALRRIGS